MKCAFCEDKAVHPCSWPVEKPTSISHWDLTEEHVVVSRQAKRHLRPLAVRRFNIERGGGLNGGMRPWIPNRVIGWRIPVTMYALQFPDGRYFLYYLQHVDRVEVLAPAECKTPCCDRHLREVGEHTRYCMEHWSSWQTVEGAAA